MCRFGSRTFDNWRRAASNGHKALGLNDSISACAASGRLCCDGQMRLTLAQPLVQVCWQQLCLLSLSQSAPLNEFRLPAHDPTRPWSRTWHFVRRTALPARAPDRLA
jgi:hypothetical protein